MSLVPWGMNAGGKPTRVHYLSLSPTKGVLALPPQFNAPLGIQASAVHLSKQLGRVSWLDAPFQVVHFRKVSDSALAAPPGLSPQDPPHRGFSGSRLMCS